YKYAGGIPRLINTLCDTALTCAYADNLREVTPQIMEAAAKELQWPVHTERMEKSRSKVRPVSPEGGVQGILRDQAHTLATIAAQLGALEKRAPALESIEKTLMAIERHLRNLPQSSKAESVPEQVPGRHKMSG
ncbi:MAG TPA: hypothetical protein VFK92_01410, partial [Burkholderiales bacterium]|nr:hypothetical protein [Burkholderiales bacterium]